MGTYKSKVNLHIFYGVACTGKSSLAVRYAHEHCIRTIIHTDYIREVQRACTHQPNNSPLMKVTHNAWELFGEPSAEHIVQGFTTHVDAITPALIAVVRKISHDGFDAIVEGVHCYGSVLDQFTPIGGLAVLPRLLVVVSESRLLVHIQHKEKERSSAGEPKAWKNQAKTLMKIQEFLIQDANRRNIQIICTD